MGNNTFSPSQMLYCLTSSITPTEMRSKNSKILHDQIIVSMIERYSIREIPFYHLERKSFGTRYDVDFSHENKLLIWVYKKKLKHDEEFKLGKDITMKSIGLSLMDLRKKVGYLCKVVFDVVGVKDRMDKLEKRMDELEKRIEKRMDNLEKRMDDLEIKQWMILFILVVVAFFLVLFVVKIGNEMDSINITLKNLTEKINIVTEKINIVTEKIN